MATNYAGLPGAELVVEGLDDLAAGRESVSSLLIEIGAPRHEPDSAYSRYNALLRRLVSFERALARMA